MFPVPFVSRSFSKTTSAQDVAPLLFLKCSFILESFLYQGALNNNKKKNTNNTNLPFFIVHERLPFSTLSMDALGAVSVGDAGQLAVCVIEKGNVERWKLFVLI